MLLLQEVLIYGTVHEQMKYWGVTNWDVFP